jgi:hypothetical protein
LNYNSLFGLDLEKVFFAPGLKIVLQHYRSLATQCSRRFRVRFHPDFVAEVFEDFGEQ